MNASNLDLQIRLGLMCAGIILFEGQNEKLIHKAVNDKYHMIHHLFLVPQKTINLHNVFKIVYSVAILHSFLFW